VERDFMASVLAELVWVELYPGCTRAGVPMVFRMQVARNAYGTPRFLGMR